jgi:hypothetical protein
VLTVSGVFSVLSYVVEQQAKEIGVRMALGATIRNVTGLVLSQSLRPVGIGLAAGGGLAAAVAIVQKGLRPQGADELWTVPLDGQPRRLEVDMRKWRGGWTRPAASGWPPPGLRRDVRRARC